MLILLIFQLSAEILFSTILYLNVLPLLKVLGVTRQKITECTKVFFFHEFDFSSERYLFIKCSPVTLYISFFCQYTYIICQKNKYITLLLLVCTNSH